MGYPYILFFAYVLSWGPISRGFVMESIERSRAQCENQLFRSLSASMASRLQGYGIQVSGLGV